MRIYKYIIINRIGAPVLDKERGWHVTNNLNLLMMKKAAKKLVGTKDFSTFRASSCRAKTPIKTMKSVKVKSRNNKIEIEFQSKSFLQQQVRSMVGCLKYVGEKKWSVNKFNTVMNKKKRILCAQRLLRDYTYKFINFFLLLICILAISCISSSTNTTFDLHLREIVVTSFKLKLSGRFTFLLPKHCQIFKPLPSWRAFARMIN